MIGWIILGLVILFFAVLVIRALLFRPRPQPSKQAGAVAFDENAAVSALQKLVQ